mmetsp:Transcript_46616/g.91709  ORF Transcript_46616/g.91709 Transcript_46616/m.91709 type:complete len:243 (-) Transcript_46616:277-1005(-)
MSVTVHPVVEGILEVHINDGKLNAFTLDMIREVDRALDKAEKEDIGSVLLVGNQRAFSAGFDLTVMGGPPSSQKAQLYMAGANLMLRMFEFPRPIVIACTGHAIALGAIMLMAVDVRIGAREAKYKIGMNEVAINMPVPVFGVELARSRIKPAALSRATTQAVLFNPEAAVEVGYLDQAVPKADVINVARREATRLKVLKSPNFSITKQRERGAIASVIRNSLADDRNMLMQELQRIGKANL